MMLGSTLQADIDKTGPDGSEAQREYIRQFVADLKSRPIAEQTAAANEQHYEIDTRFYNLVLGKHRKYSAARCPSTGP